MSNPYDFHEAMNDAADIDPATGRPRDAGASAGDTAREIEAVARALWDYHGHPSNPEMASDPMEAFGTEAHFLLDRLDRVRADSARGEDHEAVARAFHEAYERLAPDFGYKTREESAVPWEDVPEQNKALMRATVAEAFPSSADDTVRLREVERWIRERAEGIDVYDAPTAHLQRALISAANDIVAKFGAVHGDE